MYLGWYKSLEWFKRTKRVRRILFVCSGNSCRSPTAEYYFNRIAHWLKGVRAFSRGTEVGRIMAILKSRGIDIKHLMVEDEVKRVIGDKTSSFLKKHRARQVSAKDVVKADLVLTMEKSARDLLRAEYSGMAYKIFTLKGFIEQTDHMPAADLNIGNPFIPPVIREEKGIIIGRIGYYRYIQNYRVILEMIEGYVRRLIEIIYLLEEEKKRQ